MSHFVFVPPYFSLFLIFSTFFVSTYSSYPFLDLILNKTPNCFSLFKINDIFKTNNISIKLICVRSKLVHPIELFHVTWVLDFLSCFLNKPISYSFLAYSLVVLHVKGHSHLIHFFINFLISQDKFQVICPQVLLAQKLSQH